MNVNRIFCIGRNYAKHVAELGNAQNGECLIFMKPASAVVEEGKPVVLPKNIGSIHHEAELVVQLSGGGRDVPVVDAIRNISGITLGLDLTARDLQATLKSKGAPWELAKAFDCSAPLGDFKPYAGQDLQNLEFTFHVNGERRQHAQTGDMLYSVARQIHILSQTWALLPGDVIYTGTPEGVAPLNVGDQVVLEGRGLGRYEWAIA